MAYIDDLIANKDAMIANVKNGADKQNVLVVYVDDGELMATWEEIFFEVAVGRPVSLLTLTFDALNGEVSASSSLVTACGVDSDGDYTVSVGSTDYISATPTGHPVLDDSNDGGGGGMV